MSEKIDLGKIELDGLIHQPARLKILTLLYAVDEGDVVFIKRKTGLTWGNISSHVSKLEDGKMILVTKEIVNKKMRTTLKMTEEGRKAFEDYRKELKKVIEYNN
ncbi:MAG: transcriptional regulator [Candidatus Heimdallarchaeota archaeon]|nr:transcriptional regulator [Candidatus Heimdallarchaeota archaeon]MCK5049290.1 transcriptional regulator [Candidatus Heimdallarchaeota archaeon]